MSRPPPLPYWKDRKTGRRVPRGIFIQVPRSYAVSPHALELTLPSDL